MWGGEDLVIPTALAGGWRAADGRTHLFVFSIADEIGQCTVTLRASEYGIKKDAIPAALTAYSPVFCASRDALTLHFDLEKQDAIHIEF